MCAAASRPLFTLTPRAVKRLDTARKSLRGQPWVVIDGNNVMSALGRNQSLEHCTLEFDEWAHENGLGNRVLTVWDGGSEASAHALPRSGVVFSGDHQIADEVIVQAVGLLRGPAVVITTDKALRGRCFAQRVLQVETDVARGLRASDAQPAAELHELTCLHSIYLGWMLEERDPSRRPHDRTHRREQARRLAERLRQLDEDVLAPTAREDEERRRLRKLVDWFDGPEPRGLSIARETRHSNILYAYESGAFEDERGASPLAL